MNSNGIQWYFQWSRDWNITVLKFVNSWLIFAGYWVQSRCFQVQAILEISLETVIINSITRDDVNLTMTGQKKKTSEFERMSKHLGVKCVSFFRRRLHSYQIWNPKPWDASYALQCICEHVEMIHEWFWFFIQKKAICKDMSVLCFWNYYVFFLFKIGLSKSFIERLVFSFAKHLVIIGICALHI